MMDCFHFEEAPSCQDSLEAIEFDIQHANMLAASISRAKGSTCLQMKLVYNHLAPVHLDSKQKFPSHGRKATIGQFYAMILPSLEHLHDSSLELESCQDEVHDFDKLVGKKKDDKNIRELDLDVDVEREDECGICLEACTEMVLPNCCHAMCINCYRDWNMRSESCPFCRGNIKRVKSGDLWVMTCDRDVVEQERVSKEDMLRLYLYINKLPKDIPDADAVFLFYYEYLI